ncbi:MAG: hypothetical protein KKG14_14775 [Alphaproteobacteria bacterium]|nr:hypothetical protein [Alphaproteobacteria bacterium]MBU2269838.1 hypothetical protein [Alphaproteobacteria bacterium]MBU2419962.1 hypothetical protein [Alphaproteobacteria bacterium]
MNARIHASEELGPADFDYLSDTILSLKRSLLIVMDREGLGQLASELERGWDFKPKDLRKIDHFDDEPDFAFSKPINYLGGFLETLRPLLEPPSDIIAKIGIAEQIALNGAHLLQLDGLTASKEKHVHDAILKYMKVAFPSTVDRPVIKQATKATEPDIGVTELGYAIEVKYATDRNETLGCVGGIYEDMKLYAGSSTWTRFLGAIYTTDAAVTQGMIDAQGAKIGVPASWKVRVLCVPAAQSALKFRKSPRPKLS